MESRMAKIPGVLSHFSFLRKVSLVHGALFCVLSIGCGPQRPKTVEVSGVVTVDGQRPPGPGEIYFSSVAASEGFPARPGTAQFDATGNFTVQTFEEGDGLMPGRYRLVVYCWKTPPTVSGNPAESYIHKRYASSGTSGIEELTVDVDSKKMTYNIDLDSAP